MTELTPCPSPVGAQINSGTQCWLRGVVLDGCHRLILAVAGILKRFGWFVAQQKVRDKVSVIGLHRNIHMLFF